MTKEKIKEMRNAIDQIEGALMSLSGFVDLPALFVGAPDNLGLRPQMTLGAVRRVCTALAECTRIINSQEYNVDG